MALTLTHMCTWGSHFNGAYAHMGLTHTWVTRSLGVRCAHLDPRPNGTWIVCFGDVEQENYESGILGGRMRFTQAPAWRAYTQVGLWDTKLRLWSTAGGSRLVFPLVRMINELDVG